MTTTIRKKKWRKRKIRRKEREGGCVAVGVGMAMGWIFSGTLPAPLTLNGTGFNFK